MAIRFFEENIACRIQGKTLLKSWIRNSITIENRIPGNISIILCSDEFLSEINLKYLKHRTLTDVISFPEEEKGTCVAGEVYISYPRVKENALLFQQELNDELRRVIIHGILHLMGYSDKTKTQRENMTKREDFLLNLFPG
ncbi:MAG TPA: rRNA maturation RNase YbeY [Bacteroidales bacterium]|nr:rRNA maturation RNase YbeY [Bacteroidales bacterium]